MNQAQFMSYDEVLEYDQTNPNRRMITLQATTDTIKLRLEKKGSTWELRRHMTDKKLCAYKTLGKVYEYIIYTYLNEINPSTTFDDHVKRHQIPQPPQIESGVTGLLEPNKKWSPSIADFDTRTMYPINHLLEEFDKLNKKPQFATGDVLDIQGTKLLVKSYNPISERYTVYPYVLGEFISATSYSAKLIDNQATKVYSLNTESEENENEHIN